MMLCTERPEKDKKAFWFQIFVLGLEDKFHQLKPAPRLPGLTKMQY